MKYLMVMFVLVVAFSLVVSPILACCPNDGDCDDCGSNGGGCGQGGCGHKLISSNCGCDCGCNDCPSDVCNCECCQH